MSPLTLLQYWLVCAAGLGCVLFVVSVVIVAWMWIIGKGRS